MKLDFDALLVLASNYRDRTVRLSDESLALFLSLTGYADQRWQWENDNQRLNDAEWDVADEIVSKAELEIMTPLVGMVMPVLHGTLPAGWLLCDGSTYDAADYPDLWAVIDPAYKSLTTFTVPDLTKRFPMGFGGDVTLNSQGGEDRHILTTDEMPSHTHTDSGHQHTAATFTIEIEAVGADLPVPVFEEMVGLSGIASANIQPTGGGQGHNNIPPYTAVKWAVIAR